MTAEKRTLLNVKTVKSNVTKDWYWYQR